MTTFRDRLKPRFAALGVVVLVVFGSLLVRLWAMQVVAGDAFARQAENNRIREITVDAPRGRILDRKGRLLVSNRAVLGVTLDPSSDAVRGLVALAQNSDKTDDPTPAQLAKALGPLAARLKVTPAVVFERLLTSKVEAHKPRVVAIDVPIATVSYILEHQPDFPGVGVEELGVRQYPLGSLAAHVLGYTGEISEQQLADPDLSGYHLGDVVGKTGAERQFESVLQGDKGVRHIEVDAAGRLRRVVDRTDPIPGRDVVLTLDIDIQRITEEALAGALSEARRQRFYKARSGAAVVLDVKTGEVLAMASAPTYDPALFIGGIGSVEWKRLNAPNSEYPLNNRAIMSAYPPASTFKAITGLAGLQNKITSEYRLYDCAGRWTAMGEQWPKWCWKRTGHGSIDFANGIEQSCDTVFYEIGYAFYKKPGEKFQAFARASGFGSVTGIDLPGEVPGRVPDAAWKRAFNKDYPEYRTWLPGDTVNMAIGQGDLLATPLQLAAGYAGIANGGRVMQPHVMRRVLDSAGKTVLVSRSKVAYRIPASAGVLGVMRRGLVSVTENGTAKGAFRGFKATVAGKTGTAEVRGKDDYALFAAYAPAESPRYAVVVIIEQGGHGGSVAAPAARRIIAKLLGLPTTAVRATDASR
ncbi:MAG: penicillin-binding protein 2 [Coriobacteriia bacterium]